MNCRAEIEAQAANDRTQRKNKRARDETPEKEDPHPEDPNNAQTGGPAPQDKSNMCDTQTPQLGQPSEVPEGVSPARKTKKSKKKSTSPKNNAQTLEKTLNTKRTLFAEPKPNTRNAAARGGKTSPNEQL